MQTERNRESTPPPEQQQPHWKQTEAVQREFDELYSELKRKDRRLQRVIERYEFLLAEKNRELVAAQSSTSKLTGIRDVIQWLPLNS